ncbi:MAG: hypothetical protein A3K19_21245 [Lentisphaerae bacterium RIFOXYB12_FULL_65_16]|nr:MAG: hypothetical protein A3K18_33920 [Lentisphaerae bacterium RIFOXYA12_64_32]OGV93658.1 MAG: hypothetical protein A3K19_21245 [Lentisphaerae bacterium RIFOXYB12_FULL_65_16]
MPGSTQRVMQAFAHQAPDRTPLFEIFQPCHPVHWDICGRNIATDMALQWDAYADGVAHQELVDAKAKAVFAISKFFGLDMVHFPGDPPARLGELRKTGPTAWRLNGVDYVLDARTKLIVLANPGEADADSHRLSEDDLRRQVEQWDGTVKPLPKSEFAVYRQVQRLAAAEGLDWVYMGEVGGGTGVAFFPPFMLMWFVCEPELLHRWVAMQSAHAMPLMRRYVELGAAVIAIGGDVSCDKGPFCSPAHYREFVLPAIQEQVSCIHAAGGKVVYTSDGNHWPIRDDFFFNSGIDGYKEVDFAAGMTLERLIAEGVKDRVCLIGNVDARHTMCQGTCGEVRAHVRRCLELGRQTPGGHILHLSHSVHEDVQVENYHAMIGAYREFFGLEPLPRR